MTSKNCTNPSTCTRAGRAKQEKRAELLICSLNILFCDFLVAVNVLIAICAIDDLRKLGKSPRAPTTSQTLHHNIYINVYERQRVTYHEMFIRINCVQAKSCQHSISISTDTAQCRVVMAFQAHVFQQNFCDSCITVKLRVDVEQQIIPEKTITTLTKRSVCLDNFSG